MFPSQFVPWNMYNTVRIFFVFCFFWLFLCFKNKNSEKLSIMGLILQSADLSGPNKSKAFKNTCHPVGFPGTANRL